MHPFWVAFPSTSVDLQYSSTRSLQKDSNDDVVHMCPSRLNSSAFCFHLLVASSTLPYLSKGTSLSLSVVITNADLIWSFDIPACDAFCFRFPQWISPSPPSPGKGMTSFMPTHLVAIRHCSAEEVKKLFTKMKIKSHSHILWEDSRRLCRSVQQSNS